MNAVAEKAFSRELYINGGQIQTLCRHGMYVGSHGCDRSWIDTNDLPKDSKADANEWTRKVSK